jgi:quinoprotein relay system zinc metallohydrolase 1
MTAPLRSRLAMGLLYAALLGAVGGGLPGFVHLAHAQGPNVADAATLDYRLQPRLLAPNTWVIEGAVDDFTRANGCNIINTGFIVTSAGVVVINTGPSRLYGEAQRRAIAQVTPQPVVQVVSLNLHPDYFFGHQAWRGVPTLALAGTIAGMQAEGKAYEDNLFRLCGDWMKGTESTPSQQVLEPGRVRLGGHDLEWLRLSGHTSDDLVLIDHTTGVVFAGGLVFAERGPTTPHAHLARWRESLQALKTRLADLNNPWVVPSHGPIHRGAQGTDQTLDWIAWLEQTLQHSAQQGLDLGEVMRTPIPPRFAGWAAMQAEFVRTVTYLYPAYELAVMTRK